MRRLFRCSCCPATILRLVVDTRDVCTGIFGARAPCSRRAIRFPAEAAIEHLECLNRSRLARNRQCERGASCRCSRADSYFWGLQRPRAAGTSAEQEIGNRALNLGNRFPDLLFGLATTPRVYWDFMVSAPGSNPGSHD
jgi:hypothetical protein